ncbi:Ubiquinone biosynthesis UbiH/UbiF/VisC/COQ6 family hydroxylase [Paracidovorax anthurii]|uniref:Ubiquinone biosynthesis UbiH/UbiF/VisC/COQ6 family hydroxylase n=2 Tax=Paracidovorax anthurii TaxID=78229 RepID=A0A328ZMJ0_9BURK|nr:ubiquinone biosynthesis UbiH/UbiF/VisC/COQ6 family hydroxylase [Paracidovorax anthurii]
MPAMAQTFDVCIRGAGVVGRALSLLLARERLRVALVPGPAPAEQGEDVRAYALNAASRSLLESVRSWPGPGHATAVRRMDVHGDQGGEVTFDAHRHPGADALAWIVDVPALEGQLADAVRFQPQVEVVDAPVNATLTVVCEGRVSRTREEFGARYTEMPYAQHAVATRLRCEQPHGQVARQWFLPDGILAFLPLDGPEGNAVAVVWSVTHEEAQHLLATDPADFEQRIGAASQGTLGHATLIAPRRAWPLVQAHADRWCGPLPARDDSATKAPARSWALAGDAAHTVHPLAGQGLNLGLADALALARVLRERDYWRGVADLRLLRRYERERKTALLPMGWAMDGLQQLFARHEGPVPWLRNWGMRGFERSGPLKDWVTRQAMGLG